RDRNVTGVQTCALPISPGSADRGQARNHQTDRRRAAPASHGRNYATPGTPWQADQSTVTQTLPPPTTTLRGVPPIVIVSTTRFEIGRTSWRERVRKSGG